MSNRLKLVGIALLISATVALSFYAHTRAGAWMPIPWVDESTFAWPSIAFAETGSFVAPQANPDRAAFWMPPGYYVLSGTVYKILGYSPEIMRGIAWAFASLYFLVLTHWLYHTKWPGECFVLAAGFTLNAFFVVMGNVGRMEPIVLSLCLIAYWLIHQQRPWQGLAMMGALMLIHPYAGMFGAFGLLTILLSTPASLKRFGKLDAACLIVAALPWILYVFYVSQNLPDFLHDMKEQGIGHHEMLAIDRGVDPRMGTFELTFRALFLSKYTALLMACAVLMALVWRWDRAALPLLAFGTACLLIRMLGAEQWYVVLAVNAILLWLLVAIRLWCRIVLPRVPARLHLPLRLALLAGILMGGMVAGLIPKPKRYPNRLLWWECSMLPGDSYITKQDAAAVLTALSNVPGITPDSRVEVKPHGEGLWFYPESRGQFVIHAPVFTSLKPDWQVVHLHPKLRRIFPDSGLNTNHAVLLHSRGKHAWYLKNTPEWKSK